MSCFSSHPPAPTTFPTLRFIGPDTRETMYLENAQGVRTPIFALNINKHTKPSLSVYRIAPNGHQQPFFTSSTSSMSGTSRINIHNREIKMEISYEGMQLRREFHGPMGKLGWYPAGMGSDQKLKDRNGTVLAKFDTRIDSGSAKEPQLSILVQCDDYLTDLILATGLTVYMDAMKEKKQVSSAAEILGSVLGA
ncbi:hypothetical protein N0V90_006001 [Kalmusia sp. IMI 367209]|nr:hypothetical protein N0V90_006001 [Kalmusia sp. IMI 367209]